MVVILVLSIVSVLIIVYPLFFSKLTQYQLPDHPSLDFNEQDSLLATLNELEEDYQLGHLSTLDYERLKLYFQRRYLKLKQTSVSEDNS